MSTRTSAVVGLGPLHGVRVVELGQYISGPYAGKLLADLGADVVKVEAPEGDPMRRWEGDGQAYSPQFAAYNRNKSSIVLDLKSSDGLQHLLDLVRTADVLIENFRPGVADRLGFDPRTAAALNKRLVYCSITGFGTQGPYAGRPAYDTVISAIGGMYSQLVPMDTPRPIGPAFADLLAGQSAVQGVLAALHARSQDGHGQRVEVSMLGSLIDFLTETASTYLLTGDTSWPGTRSRRAQAYACVGSDGRAFVVHMSVPEKFWRGLCDVLERPDLATDPRFATREARVANYDDLDTVLKTVTAGLPRQEWMRRLAQHDIPHGPVNTVSELFDDPQVAAMDLVHEVDDGDGTVTMPLHSTLFHRSGRPRYRTAPDLGVPAVAGAPSAGDDS